MLKIFRHEGAGLILYNSGHQVTMCKKYSFQRPMFYNTGGGHPGQTGLAIIAIWSEEPLLRLLEFHNLLRPKLVVRKFVIGYLHDPRWIERFGEFKQEVFKSNMVIIKSRMEVRIWSRIEWHDRYTISPLKARKDWCASGSLFQCSFGLWEMFLGTQALPRNREAYVDTKNWQIPRFAMQSGRTGQTGCISRSDRSG